MKEKNCNDCVYGNKEGCSVHVIRCEYPLPNALTQGSVCTNPYSGIGCVLLKTKAELAIETKADNSTKKR